MGKVIKVTNGKDTFDVKEDKLGLALKDGFAPTERIIVANSKTGESYEVNPDKVHLAYQDGYAFKDFVKKKEPSKGIFGTWENYYRLGTGQSGASGVPSESSKKTPTDFGVKYTPSKFKAATIDEMADFNSKFSQATGSQGATFSIRQPAKKGSRIYDRQVADEYQKNISAKKQIEDAEKKIYFGAIDEKSLSELASNPRTQAIAKNVLKQYASPEVIPQDDENLLATGDHWKSAVDNIKSQNGINLANLIEQDRHDKAIQASEIVKNNDLGIDFSNVGFDPNNSAAVRAARDAASEKHKLAVLAWGPYHENSQKYIPLLNKLNAHLSSLKSTEPIANEVLQSESQISAAINEVMRLPLDYSDNELMADTRKKQATALNDVMKGLSIIKDTDPVMYERTMSSILKKGQIPEQNFLAIVKAGQFFNNEELIRKSGYDPKLAELESKYDYESMTKFGRQGKLSRLISEDLKRTGDYKRTITGNVPFSFSEDEITRSANRLGIDYDKEDLYEVIQREKTAGVDGIPKWGRGSNVTEGIMDFGRSVNQTVDALIDDRDEFYVNSGRILGKTKQDDGSYDYNYAGNTGFWDKAWRGFGRFAPQLAITYATGGGSSMGLAGSALRAKDIASMAPGVFLQSYGSNLSDAMKYTDDDSKAHLMAGIGTSIELASEGLFPDVARLRGAVKPNMKLLKELPNIPFNELAAKGKPIIEKFVKGVAKSYGQEVVIEEGGGAIVKSIMDGLLFKERSDKNNAADEFVKTLKSASIDMIIPSVLFGAADVAKSPSNQMMLNDAAYNLEESLSDIEELVENGTWTKEKYDQAAEILTLHNRSLMNAPMKTVGGKELTPQQRSDYALNTTLRSIRQRQMTELAEKTGDEIQTRPIQQEIKKLEQENEEIFTSEEKTEDDKLLDKLKKESPETLKDADLQYFIDKAGEDPVKFEKDYGSKITKDLIDRIPTEKLIQYYNFVAKVDETSPAAVRLDEILGEREAQESIVDVTGQDEALPVREETAVSVQMPQEVTKPNVIQPTKLKSVLERPIEEVSVDDILNELTGSGLKAEDVNAQIQSTDTSDPLKYSDTATKILKALYPNAEVNVFNNTEDYVKAGGSYTSRGVAEMKAGGKHNIALNLEAIRDSGSPKTVVHEVLHPIVYDKYGIATKELNEAWNRIQHELKDVEGIDLAINHARQYPVEQRGAEGVTEFLTQIVTGNIDINSIPAHKQNVLLEVLNKLLELLGIKANLTKQDDFIAFTQRIKQAFETGSAEGLKADVEGKGIDKFMQAFDNLKNADLDPAKRKKLQDLLVKKLQMEVEAGNISQKDADKVLKDAGIQTAKTPPASSERGEGGSIPPTGIETLEESNQDGDFDYMVNNVPDTGAVDEYLSKGTIEKYTDETPLNNQARGVQELSIALSHGELIIAKAKQLYGDDYVEKTLDYIDKSKAPNSSKALVYVSLENALGREKLNNPQNAGEIAKLQELVYSKSQQFAREASLTLNYQKLRKFAKVGYDINKITDNFFSPEEAENRSKLEKAIQATPEEINKAAEQIDKGYSPEDLERMIKEGVEKEIQSIYEQLPSAKKSAVDRAIAALDKVQQKLRSRTYESTIGIPVAIIDAGITVIKKALKLGGNISDAVELGIKEIKRKLGKEWKNEDKFRRDAIKFYNEEISQNPKSEKELVRQILIDKGFGREYLYKGEKRKVLDWKKLAGAAGSMAKIRENVNAALMEKGLRGLSDAKKGMIKEEFLREYVDIRTWVIERSLAELAKRNKENVTPEQKTAAKRLSEMYNYGLFDKNADEFDNLTVKALGAKVSEQGYKEAKDIAHAMELIYATSFNGIKLTDVSAKAAIERLEDKMRVLLFREAKKQGNFMYKAANIVRNYFEIQQTMILNSFKQAVENPFSGLQQNIIDRITTGKSLTPEMRRRVRGLMKSVFRDMVLKGGVGYGKVESQFVNRQHLDDYVNNLSDSEVYHAIASVVTGKATLNAMDAMFKAGITEKKFAHNLMKILTHESNPNKISKDEALKFVSEKLSGQSFEDAKKTARTTIERINKDYRESRKKRGETEEDLMPVNEENVVRFANDIVKAALEVGGKINDKQIKAAYDAAYKTAGLGLGHESNNILSGTIKGYSAKLEGDINGAIKDKEWNRAAFLTYKSVLFRNIINPFVGGGTNWLVLKLEKAGLGLFTGLMYQIGSKKQIDLSSETGLKTLEKRLYNHARYKDNYMRGLVGAVVSGLTYAAFLAIADTDEYERWRKRNKWASKYIDIFTPEWILARMAVDQKEVKNYAESSFNRGDAFASFPKMIQSAEYFSKGQPGRAWGKMGEAIGTKFNAPLPWRLVRDGQVIFQGALGHDPYRGDYRPSNGFFNGVFQGGVIEYLGWRPGNTIEPDTFTIKDSEKAIKRQATQKEVEEYEKLSKSKYEKEMKRLEEEWIQIDKYGDVSVEREEKSDVFKIQPDGKEVKFSNLNAEQKKQLEEKIKRQMNDMAKKELFGEEN